MRMHIVEAADRLAETHSFDDISVTDICRAANVSRQTFYNHFKDKLDMLFWERSAVMNGFFYEYSTVCGWNETLSILLRKDSHAKNLLQKVTVSKDNDRFIRQCFDLYADIFRRELKARGIVETSQHSFYIRCGAWIMGHVLDEWYRSGCELDPDVMLAWLDEMTPALMRSMRDADVRSDAKHPF